MSRPLRRCWSLRFLGRCWFLELFPVLPLVLWLILAISLRSVLLPLFLVLIGYTGFILLMRLLAGWYVTGGWKLHFWVGRFTRRVADYRRVDGDRVAVLAPAGLVDAREILLWAEADLADLAGRFGRRLRRRLTVVLVPSYRDLWADFGRWMGGVALPSATAVVIAVDCPPIRDLIRHELAHLFAARWNLMPPPLIQEGLAVWLESADSEVPSLGPQLGRRPKLVDHWPELDRVLDVPSFFAPSQMTQSYASAGIFTGYLIRRFGWERYRRFYRRAERLTLRRSFRRHFGTPLDDAWRRCRDDSAVLAILDRRLRNDCLFGLRH